MTFLPRMAAAVAAAAMFPAIGAAQQSAQADPRTEAQPRIERVQAPQLSEQQREQMRALRDEERTAERTARFELDELRRQFERALTAPEPDRAKIDELRAALVQKETALTQRRLDRLSRLSAILTPEQREALGGRGLDQVFGRAGGRGMMMRRGRAMGGRPAMRGQMMRRGPIGDGGRMMLRDRAIRERMLRRQHQLWFDGFRHRIR